MPLIIVRYIKARESGLRAAFELPLWQLLHTRVHHAVR